MPNFDERLQHFTDEELSTELESRKINRLAAWRNINVARHRKLSVAVIDLIAPLHSKTDFSDCTKLDELLVSGWSKCNRCSLEAMRKYPERFSDVRVDFTIDFTVSKQVSFE
jgi:hypothetical protein